MKQTHRQIHFIIISIGITFLLFSPIFFVSKTENSPQIQTRSKIIQQPNSNENSIFIKDESNSIVLEDRSDIISPNSDIFGKNLQEEIRYSGKKEINVLVVFGEEISLPNQLLVLNQAGLHYTVKKQYINFPIALIEVSLEDLQQSKDLLKAISGIERFFKDTTTTVNLQDLPSSSAGLEDEENWWLDAIGATNLPYDGSGVSIAILDTGIYSSHADFASKTPLITHINFATESGLSNYSDYDDIQGHGTHVAGIAAGTGVSSSGKYNGVAPGASLLNVKTLNNYGGITDSDLLDAVDWLITQENADIISMSFRTEAQDSVYNPISIALESAAEHGIIPIAAAGNYGPQYITASHPASASSVISVGAINRDLEVTSFSSLGPSYMGEVIPDILAPGDYIIAAESKNSLIGLESRYTNSYISGSESDSDYITLSGTSMATPMVAGATALILDAYPDLTPETVRAALYQGSYLPDHYSGLKGANGIGAGIINVSASISWLNSLGDTSNIVQAFPDVIPQEPVNLLAYPGDSQSVNISISSGKPGPISLNITVPQSSNLEIIPSTTTLSFVNHSVQHIQFEMTIRNNATMGIEAGSIFINDSSTGDLLEQLDYLINISYPKGRVYFDSMHGMNDLFPEWPSGYSQIEIFSAMKLLHENGYQLVYEMENWTKAYQNQLTSRLLSLDLLSTMDIIVLQTPVIGYTELERNALEEYVSKGGSILVLGTRSQSLAIDSLNSLLTQLDTDIAVNTENIFDYNDIGFGWTINKQTVTDVDSNSPIFNEGDKFSYWYGPTLEIGPDAAPIATLQDKTVVASHDSVSGGRVVVWSDYHWLRNDIFDEANTAEHEQILLNLFGYLNTQEENEYILEAVFNSTIQSTSDLELHLSIQDSTTRLPITNRIYGSTLNASLISPSATSTPLVLNSLGNGIYSNTSFSLDSTDYRPYTLQVNVSTPLGTLTQEYHLYRIDVPNQVQIADPTSSSPIIYRDPGTNTTIRYIGNTPGLNSKIYGSLSADSIYSSKPLLEYSLIGNAVGIQYNHLFTLTGTEPSGLFAFFSVAIDSNNYTNFQVTRSIVVVDNHIPEINEVDSTFESIPFADTREDDSIFILSVDSRNEIDLSVKIEEVVPYEDQTSEMYVIAYYTAAVSVAGTFDRIIPNSIPTTLLEYVDGGFKGQFEIPKKLTFTGASGSIEISQQSHEDYTYFSVLWITVRDTDGGSVDYVLLLFVNIIFDWDSLLDYLPLIIVILAILGIAITIVVIFKKRRQKGTSQSPYYDNQTGYRSPHQVYCMHCGKQIDSSYQVCPHCGKFLP